MLACDVFSLCHNDATPPMEPVCVHVCAYTQSTAYDPRGQHKHMSSSNVRLCLVGVASMGTRIKMHTPL